MRLEPFKGLAPDESGPLRDDWVRDGPVRALVKEALRWADVVELRYSADQPRDEDGRFAGGSTATETNVPRDANGMRTVISKDYLEHGVKSRFAVKLASGKEMGLIVEPSVITHGQMPTDEQIQHILSTAADMQDKYNADKTAPIIYVGNDDTAMFAGTLGAMAWTEVVGSGSGSDSYKEISITVNAQEMGLGKDYKGADVKGSLGKEFTADPLRQLDYNVIHEYGHVIDAENDNKDAWSFQSLVQYAQQVDKISMNHPTITPPENLSPYGQTSSFEAYAECFVDWVLSNGETTNEATLTAQKMTGWAKP